MSFGLPYGWGCRFAKSRANRYCFRQAQQGWGACIPCDKLKNHPDYDKVISDLKEIVQSSIAKTNEGESYK